MSKEISANVGFEIGMEGSNSITVGKKKGDTEVGLTYTEDVEPLVNGNPNGIHEYVFCSQSRTIS